jgi:pimeloyl-ACP methyl ester carboxylesterase
MDSVDPSRDATPALPADLEYRDTLGPRPRLHYVAAGAGPPVLLLHGFPDFWYGWHQQLAPLAAAGYRVVAPDQRGYNRSDKPRAVRAYRLDALAEDVLRLAEAVAPGQPVALVGHDWGAIVAWWIALHHPERLSRLVVLSAPHPAVLPALLCSDPLRALGQLRRSWYIAAFQLPALPEWVLGRHDYAGLAWILRATSQADVFSPEDLGRYRAAWAAPGALAGMVHWYRALLRHPVRPRHTRVRVPALIVWGERDSALDRALAEPSRALCDEGHLVVVAQAGHWPQIEAPAQVTRLLLDFLASGPATGGVDRSTS